MIRKSHSDWQSIGILTYSEAFLKSVTLKILVSDIIHAKTHKPLLVGVTGYGNRTQLPMNSSELVDGMMSDQVYHLQLDNHLPSSVVLPNPLQGRQTGITNLRTPK